MYRSADVLLCSTVRSLEEDRKVTPWWARTHAAAKDHMIFGTGGSHIQNMKLTEIYKDLMLTIEQITDFDRGRHAGDPGLVCRNRPTSERVTD